MTSPEDHPAPIGQVPWMLLLLLAWGNTLPGMVEAARGREGVALRALVVSLAVAALWGLSRFFARLLTRRVAPAPLGAAADVSIRLVWGTFLGLAVLAALVDTLILMEFGHRIRPRLIFVAFETNPREAYEFLHMYTGWRTVTGLGMLLAPLALFAVAQRRGTLPAALPRHLHPRPAARTLLGLLVVAGGLGFVGWPRHSDLPLASFAQAVAEYRVETEAYYRLKETLRVAVGRTGAASAELEGDELYVFVLGESTGRNHMSLYGYPRPTTPRLEGLGPELLVFRDVVSHQSHTQAVLRELFTFFGQESTRPWHEHPTLFEVLGQAGFRTWWISNQEMYGLWANIGGALASQADVKIFHKHRRSREERGSALFYTTRDEDLIPYLRRAAAGGPDEPRFVLLHLMGTHGWYRNRYPLEFARFEGTPLPDPDRPWLDWKSRRTIDAYDDAVLYNDHVLGEMVEVLRASGRPSFLLYVSDHGEEVFDSRDFRGHSESHGSRFMIEVPMLLWASEAYRERHPGRVRAAREAVDRPFMTDDLIHVCLDLAGVRHPSFEPRRSVVNEVYEPGRRRTYAGKDYDRELRDRHR